jgi:AraC-like DNA-binding protein
VAIQAFGQRPAVFQKIRAENQSPYELELCGMPPVSCPTLGFSIGELHPLARVATADTVLVPGLEDCGLTISQIAYEAGFGSTESLRRHFRAVTGTSPSDYRQTFNAKTDMTERA